MARPPGKRNSTISQLSGGEKALTAVALVFAIFDLNPAPFCLLDEVDAPLDENNVGRFCDIVRDMSRNVQFIFITHNKSTMEMASQLIGVTHERTRACRVWWRWMSTRRCAWPRCKDDQLAELRWILSGLGVLALAAIWWWSTRRAAQTPGNPELRESAAPNPQVFGPAATESAAPEKRSHMSGNRDWGVPPLEPLEIRTAEFEPVPLVDDEPTTTQVDPLI